MDELAAVFGLESVAGGSVEDVAGFEHLFVVGVTLSQSAFAAKRGVFAYIVDSTTASFRARSTSERAKGILMERYQVDKRRALRDAARPRPS